MEGKVAIITESASNIPANLAAELDIYVLPLKLNWAGESLRDGLDITAAEVYERQTESDYFPQTNTFTPGEMFEVIDRLSDRYEALIAILLPNELTSSIEVANLVNDMEPALPLHIIDSRTAAMAQGFIVLEAARAAKSGSSVDDVLAKARGMIGRVHFLAAIQTLKYLHQSGRVNWAQAALSSALQITPIIGIRPGAAVIDSFGRPRTWGRACQRLLDLMRDDIDDKPVHIAVSHVRHQETAHQLAADIEEQFDTREIYINYLTPVMGAVSGPMVALSYYSDQ